MKNIKIVHTVSEYIQMNDSRTNVLATIKDGIWLYGVNRRWLGQSQFDETFPIPEYKPLTESRGDNPNRSQNFMNNVKSY